LKIFLKNAAEHSIKLTIFGENSVSLLIVSKNVWQIHPNSVNFTDFCNECHYFFFEIFQNYRFSIRW
jgi:hypothetical protein